MNDEKNRWQVYTYIYIEPSMNNENIRILGGKFEPVGKVPLVAMCGHVRAQGRDETRVASFVAWARKV